MFTMVNTLNTKQIQYNQELKKQRLRIQIKKYNLYTPKYKPNETEYQKGEILDNLCFWLWRSGQIMLKSQGDNASTTD